MRIQLRAESNLEAPPDAKSSRVPPVARRCGLPGTRGGRLWRLVDIEQAGADHQGGWGLPRRAARRRPGARLGAELPCGDRGLRRGRRTDRYRLRASRPRPQAAEEREARLERVSRLA